MSLVKTLAKVAIGVAIAKGVSHVARNGLPGAGTPPSVGRGTRIESASAPGGLGDLMGDLLGGGKTSAPRTTATRRTGGGLGGILDDLSNSKSGSKTTRRANAPKGGLEDLLTGSSRSGTGGGLGDLLGGLLGGAAAGGGAGGLGSMFDQVLQGGAAQQPSRDQELAAALMLRAMIQAAKCDGKLDGDEKARLMEHLGDATKAEIAFVNAELAAPVDVDGLAAQVPQGMEQQAYLMSLMAIDLDSPNEAQYLHTLAQALGLDPQDVNAIHDQAGAPHLYS